MQAPHRVLIDADIEATGLWQIGTRGHCAAGFAELLDHELLVELKRWNDSADVLFGGRVAPGDQDVAKIAAFHDRARRLAGRVQEQLGADWEVLWSHAEPDWCWSWVRRPARWLDR